MSGRIGPLYERNRCELRDRDDLEEPVNVDDDALPNVDGESDPDGAVLPVAACDPEGSPISASMTAFGTA